MKKIIYLFMIFVFAASVYSYSLDDYLYYFSFENSSFNGSNPVDISGNNINTTSINVTYSTSNYSHIGQSAFFDGMTSKIIIGDNSLFENLTEVTYYAWVWLNTTDGLLEYNVLSKWFDGVDRGYELYVQPFGNNFNIVCRQATDLQNDNDVASMGSYPAPSQSWQFIACTWNGTGDDYIIAWHNATSGANVKVQGGTYTRTNTAYNLIGSAFNSAVSGSFMRSFNGSIDDVAIIKKALTQDELKAIYDNFTLGIKPFEDLDITPPNITLIYPSNNSFYQDNFSDIINITTDESADCYLNSSDFTISVNDSTNKVFTATFNLTNGEYQYTIDCSDISLNTAYLPFVFFINNTFPANVTNATNATGVSVDVNVNVELDIQLLVAVLFFILLMFFALTSQNILIKICTGFYGVFLGLWFIQNFPALFRALGTIIIILSIYVVFINKKQ